MVDGIIYADIRRENSLTEYSLSALVPRSLVVSTRAASPSPTSFSRPPSRQTSRSSMACLTAPRASTSPLARQSAPMLPTSSAVVPPRSASTCLTRAMLMSVAWTSTALTLTARRRTLLPLPAPRLKRPAVLRRRPLSAPRHRLGLSNHPRLSRRLLHLHRFR